MYRKNIDNNKNNKLNDTIFIEQTLILLSIIDKNIDIKKIKIKLYNLITIYNIFIFSFDINLIGELYNNIIHIYHYKIDKNIKSCYTHEYYLIDDIIKLESTFYSFDNYDKLYIFFSNFNKS